MTNNIFDLQPKIVSVIQDDEKKKELEMRSFDKYRCIENIRELLKASEVRIGQIEKKAGCTAGYLSRFEKEGSKGVPSIEFLCTAAEMLNVTLDTLVKARLRQMTPTEEYLLQFISKMIEDTKAGSMIWSKEPASTLNDVGFNYHDMKAYHPLFKYMGDDFSELPGTKYASRFLPEDNMTPFGTSYNAQLPGTKETVYLMSLFSDKDYEMEIMELYIIGRDVNPICATIQTCESVVEAIRDLYKEIEVATSRIQINDYSRSVISNYLNGNVDDEIPF